jgi:carbonic anhydrase
MDIVYRFDPYAPIDLKRPRSNKEALKLLEEGNSRFADQVNHLQNSLSGDHSQPPLIVPIDAIQLGIPVVQGLEQMHAPFALVLGCADARVPIERIMDCAANDLFVVRVAGNILNDETIGSIEYAVEHLGATLIVVLGHERCGAVKAARETLAAKGKAPGHVQSLVQALAPAVKATAKADAETTAKKNEMLVAEALRTSGPVLKEKVAAGEIAVVAGHYDLDSGVVELLDAPAKK